MPQVLRCRVAAHLTTGEVVDSGDVTITEEELEAEPASGFDGKPVTELEGIVPIWEAILNDWHKVDTITVRTPDRGPIRIRVAAVAYVTGYMRLEETDD